MKLSLKVEYACRVLAQLAQLHERGEFAHLEALARVEEIPANYLVQILNELRNGGLVVSRRGKQGGYALARSPEEITLNEIIRVSDGELLEHSLEAKGESGARVARIWAEIVEVLEAKTGEYTLKTFMRPESKAMYYI